MGIYRTFYKQTGGLVEPTGLLGPAILAASFLSSPGISTRTPTPVLIASLSVVTGSVTVDALSLMAQYYGSGIFGSGYVYTPIAFALIGGSAGSALVGSQTPMGIGVVGSVASFARSVQGHSGAIGFGLYNSGSTARFIVYGQSGAGGGQYTFVSQENILVTFLMASSPPFSEVIG